MLEVTPVRAAVVRCFAERGALDLFPGSGAAAARVAPDELWLIGPLSARADLAQRARSYLSSADSDGLAVDQSDGWMAWTVSGVQAATLLERLSTIELPPGGQTFSQGLVAEVPAKVLMHGARLHLFVPAQYGHHVTGRILDACADLGVRVLDQRDLVLDHPPKPSGDS